MLTYTWMFIVFYFTNRILVPYCCVPQYILIISQVNSKGPIEVHLIVRLKRENLELSLFLEKSERH